MFGVIRLTLDDDCESMSGEEDFFSVARTIPLVAGKNQLLVSQQMHVPTFDSQ
jgi:hypothetical protein